MVVEVPGRRGGRVRRRRVGERGEPGDRPVDRDRAVSVRRQVQGEDEAGVEIGPGQVPAVAGERLPAELGDDAGPGRRDAVENRGRVGVEQLDRPVRPGDGQPPAGPVQGGVPGRFGPEHAAGVQVPLADHRQVPGLGTEDGGGGGSVTTPAVASRWR